MKVSKFYDSACKDKAFFCTLDSNKQNKELKKSLNAFLTAMQKGIRKEDALKEVRIQLESSLLDSYFAYSWQKKTVIEDFVARIERFLSYIGEVKILATNVVVTLPFKNDCLTHSVDVIVSKGKDVFGINIFVSKTKRSFKGKKYHSNLKNDLYALLSKLVLEKEYPGILIQNIYLESSEDSLGNIHPVMIEDGSLKSNVFTFYFKDYYRNGMFSYELLTKKIVEAVKTPLETNCYGCQYERLCHMQPISEIVKESVQQENTYHIPQFTESQKFVTEWVDGPLRVCAGPGSGKTATLVGRIRNLILSGIDPEFIVAITFTEKAADELQTRVSSLCVESPVISTIHALAYRILKQNASLVDGCKLLTKKDKLELINNLVEVFPPLTGFSMKVLDGPNGLLETLSRKLDKFLSGYISEPEVFLNEHPELRYDFIEFAYTFNDICKQKGYISFDEMISKCITLFETYPEVLQDYTNMYKYIMVDEYQDVNADQAKFVNLIASHGNLVVVGDDDQSIYAFRGGNSRYMLNFKQMFPAAKTVVFKENFRSSKAILNASQKLIKANEERIPKDIITTNNDGTAPAFLSSKNPDEIDRIITELLKKGYMPKDIAILASKNNTLETLHESLTCQTVLEKQLLLQDPLFGTVSDTLSLFYSNMEDAFSLYHLLRLFGADIRVENLVAFIRTSYPDVFTGDYTLENTKDNIYSALRFLHHAFYLLEGVCTPSFFVQSVSYALECEEANSCILMQELIADNQLQSIEKFHSHLTYMKRFLDDTRVDVSNVNAIHLITNHDSKGREFPAVILIDDFKEETTDEIRRLAYVAITRAKQCLYIATDNTISPIMAELKGGVA